MDKLVSAETVDSGRLREAATRKADEHILIHIANKDCIALEVKYHKRCYENYTSFLRHKPVLQSKLDCKYEKSFDVFCEEFVKENIINKENIYYMNRVKEEFVKTVARIEDTDASNYRTFRLKDRLCERFPQLVFHTPKKRNKSEIVYVECLHQGTVAESLLSEELQSELETEDEDVRDEEERDEGGRETGYGKRASLREMYNVALSLRESLRQCTSSWYENWPPHASDINGESVRKLVSPVLFNFAAWLLGFSDEPNEEEYVELDEKTTAKVFSICQDLIYVCSKGRIQTPKSLALAMAIRQISGCSSIINILNGLGHCVSLPSTMAFDSAIAQATINTSNIIPREFVVKECVNLVYDNIDFGEEVTKQTHVTNGIITQKVAVQSQTRSGHPTLIKKTQRTVTVPPSDIALRNT